MKFLSILFTIFALLAFLAMIVCSLLICRRCGGYHASAKCPKKK